MNRHAVWLMALLALWVAPGTAFAQSSGLYLGLAGGALLPLDSDISGTGVSTTADLDAGWTGVGIIGYRFANGVRGEFELGYRTADVGSITGVSSGTGEISVGSAMGNATYSFRSESPFTPYLGLGIGLASVEFDNVQPVGGSVLNDSDAVFAYQGIVGLGYRLSERVQLFTDYRYFATVDAGLSTRANRSVEGEYADHTLLVGLRFSFAAPKPAMTVEPAQPPATPAPALVPAPVPAAPKVAAPPPPVAEVPRTYIVFFDWDKADIKPEALVILTQAAANVERVPVTRIQATGHADRSGSDQHNMELSRRRAAAVRAELIRLGVSPQDIVILWKGEREPLVITADGVLEPQNRRVEISLQ